MKYTIELKKRAIKDLMNIPKSDALRIIEKIRELENGKNEFAVISYDEFLELKEKLEDYEDLLDLRTAKKESEAEPGVPLADVINSLNLGH